MKANVRSHRIPRSYSTSSLDLVQLLQANLSTTLITESITFDSLPSHASLPSANVPVFPKCRGSSFQLIGLGEHLRMFSGEPMPNSGLVGSKRSQSRAVLTAPTSPRLTKLMKECLSIEKWAEASRGWNAPGHIPWEKVPEPVSFVWTPEGSVYSRETFTKALKSNRSSRVPFSKGATEPAPISYNGVTDAPIGDVFRPSEEEIRDMMSELRCLRSYFQDSLQSSDASSRYPDKSNRTSAPSDVTTAKKTVVSQPPTLAFRRGKQAPSRLFLSKKPRPKDLSYPGIPTAFLGSPTHHTSPKPINCNPNSKSTMNAQDMIQNLRSQCSAMLVQKATPPSGKDSDDTAVEEHQTFATEDCKPVIVITEPIKKIGRNATAIAGAQAQVKSPTTKIHRVPPPSIASDKGSSVGRSRRRGGIILKANPLQATLKSPPRATSSLPTETMASSIAPPKTVRFEVFPKDITKANTSASEEDSHSITSGNEPMDPILSLSVVGFHDSALRYKGTQEVNSRPLFPPASKSRNAVSQPIISAPWKKNETTSSCAAVHSTGTMPLKGQVSFLHSSKLAPAKEPKVISEVVLSHTQHTSLTSNPLGRNSLSRIIRGPMFSAPKEIKRETVCMGPKISRHQAVETRPSSEIVGSSAEKRKSRMPGPLRSIFTRFK